MTGGQGFDWRGRCPLTSPDLDPGFQTRPGPQVLKCMCVYACPAGPGLRWESEQHAACFTCFLLVSAAG